MTPDQCPQCGAQLRVWYSLSRLECVCQCANPECALQHEGTGDTTDQAKEQFIGKSLLKNQPKNK